MPLYEHRCSVCEKITEKLISIKEAEDTIECGYCGAPAHRVISLCSFRLEGNPDGWYNPAKKDPVVSPVAEGNV